MYGHLPVCPQKFSDFNLIWYVGRAQPDMRTSMTSTRSKVKIKYTELLKFWKFHFSRSVSSAVLAWSSKLMVDYDSIWDLVFCSLSEPDFWISFSVSYHMTSEFMECRYYRTFKSKGHISLLHEARVTWFGMLVVLYVLCMLMWPWPDARSRSRSCGDDRQPPSGAFIKFTNYVLIHSSQLVS